LGTDEAETLLDSERKVTAKLRSRVTYLEDLEEDKLCEDASDEVEPRMKV
jgi:hypothetical protein